MKRRFPFITFATSFLGLSICLNVQAQVLTQTDRDLGHGFHLQESKQINVAGRWNSDKTFKFLYYGKRHVCQCVNFNISPNGKFAIFQDSANLNIGSFNAAKNSITVLSKLPAGKLQTVEWNKKDERKLEISVSTIKEGTEEIKKTRLRLK